MHQDHRNQDEIRKREIDELNDQIKTLKRLQLDEVAIKLKYQEGSEAKIALLQSRVGLLNSKLSNKVAEQD